MLNMEQDDGEYDEVAANPIIQEPPDPSRKTDYTLLQLCSFCMDNQKLQEVRLLIEWLNKDNCTTATSFEVNCRHWAKYSIIIKMLCAPALLSSVLSND